MCVCKYVCVYVDINVYAMYVHFYSLAFSVCCLNFNVLVVVFKSHKS